MRFFILILEIIYIDLTLNSAYTYNKVIKQVLEMKSVLQEIVCNSIPFVRVKS